MWRAQEATTTAKPRKSRVRNIPSRVTVSSSHVNGETRANDDDVVAVSAIVHRPTLEHRLHRALRIVDVLDGHEPDRHQRAAARPLLGAQHDVARAVPAPSR